MITALLVLHLLIASALVGVVLLQRSEGGALGMGSGGGGGGFLTGRGTANLLTRTTAALAAAFFTTSILLTLAAQTNMPKQSILESGAPASGAAAPSPAEGQPPQAPGAPEGGRGGILDKLQQPAVPRSQ
jgi:preprotein translocase subunit SecG